MSAWPDPLRPGFPQNPERDGTYMLDAPDWRQPSLMIGHWSPDWRHVRRDIDPPCPGWVIAGHFYSPAAGQKFRYHGPCHTPADLAAARKAGYDAALDDVRIGAALPATISDRIAAARAEGAEAMREVCEQAAMDEHRNREIELADMRGDKIRDVGAISFVAGGSGSAKVIASRIRALPIPAAVALARRDDGWQPFVYASPPDGLCWLLVERPETWFDAGDDGRDVGGYTGQMEMVVVLAEVYGTDTGPAFESVGYGDHGHVGDDDLVVSFIPLSAPSTPTIRARAVGEER